MSGAATPGNIPLSCHSYFNHDATVVRFDYQARRNNQESRLVARSDMTISRCFLSLARESRGCEVLGIHDRAGGRFSPHGGDSRRGMLGICEVSFNAGRNRGRWHPIGQCANSMARCRLSTHPYIDRFDIPRPEKSLCVSCSRTKPVSYPISVDFE